MQSVKHSLLFCNGGEKSYDKRCCSVAQSCQTLCNPMDCSTPGFPALQFLLELAETQVVMPSNHLVLCHPLLFLLSISPESGSFLMSRLITSGGQSIRVSASTSGLPMNIHGWFPLELTGWISFQSYRQT